MTPVEKGRFCASCQKVVRDFTRSSDREIALVLAKDISTCGRFNESQLNRELHIPKEKRPVWLAASAAAVSFMALGVNEVTAQTTTNTEQHLPQKNLPKQPISQVNGTVKDSAGLPIPGVNVINLNNTKVTSTDFDGNFTIDAKEDDILEFTFIGYKDLAISITSPNVEVIMEEDELKDDFVIINAYRTTVKKHVVGAVTTLTVEVIQDRAKKPTFFGRMFRKIGNLFKNNE